MTQTNGVPQTTVALPAIDFERCDHCQAPLDARQRYCVACGARRPSGDDPVARWYADGRRARAASTAPAAAGGAPAAGRGGGGIATALVFALLPIAAAAGIYVGRGGDDQSELLVKALSAQKAPVVNIVGGGGGGAAVSDDADGSNSGSSSKQAASSSEDDTAARDERNGGRVIARTRYGDARQLTGARVTPRVREESKRALEKIADSKGKEYVESQRGLPDQIVIP